MQKATYRSFLLLALPIVFQQLLSQSLVFVDQIMIGNLGEKIVGAIGTSGQVYFFYSVALFGILSAGSIFVAQYHGKAEHLMVRRIFGFMTTIALAFAMIITLIVLVGSHFLFSSLFPGEQSMIELGSVYTQVIVIAFIFSAFSSSFSMAMRSIERTREPVLATSVALVVNIGLNYLLIPHFGALGSAYGTLLARIIEFLLICGMFKFTNNPFKNGKLRDYWVFNRPLLRMIVKISIPVIFTELIWAAATVTISLLYTQTGTEGTAASTISNLVISLQSIVFMGVASATAVLVGKVIGEEGGGVAKRVASQLTRLALVTSVVLVVVAYFLGIPFIMQIYHFESSMTVELTKASLLVVTIMSFFKLINWFLFIGLFRAGGDTRFAFYADVGFLVFYAIPAVCIGLYILHLPVYFLIFLAMLEETFKVLVGAWRYLSGKWIHDVTRDVYHI